MNGPYIQTVLGAVAPDSIGLTLPHEHTYCELWHVWDRHDFALQFPDEDTLVEELSAFKAGGGSCVVDVTVRGIERNPLGQRRLSERTGLAIVMGTGWYREPWYPPEDLIDRRSVDDLAEVIIKEFIDGVDETGIKPGIIGEIGSHKSWVTGQEERVFRASARAARATGMAVTTHSTYSPVGLWHLKILEEEGADPTRVIIGHMQGYPFLDYCLKIIERGACVQFETFGRTNSMIVHREPKIVRLILELLERGHKDQILISQDLYTMDSLKTFGGNGYDYLPTTLLPLLRQEGVPEAYIHTITVLNPRRLLQIG
jgi:predicted metal-dependent phosphotriesterase family hydrolase